MITDKERIARLETTIQSVADYQDDGKVWREQVVIALTKISETQLSIKDYQARCDKDRDELNDRCDDHDKRIIAIEGFQSRALKMVAMISVPILAMFNLIGDHIGDIIRWVRS